MTAPPSSTSPASAPPERMKADKAKARKERLDKLLVDRGYCETRNQAQALIMTGGVRLDGQVVTKAGTLVRDDIPTAALQLDSGLRYVSRGGLKLEKALEAFPLKPAGQLCMDVGASTGGFTDCLLQNGAARVIAVDVGFNQLAWSLRTDDRVRSLEKTHIGKLTPEELGERPTLGVVDTSFISLKKVLPPLATLMAPQARIMALVKPQFEHRDYCPEDKNFKGVVRQPDIHERILNGVLADLSGLLPGWEFHGLDFSPITGPKGNIEFLLYLARNLPDSAIPFLSGTTLAQRIQDVVAEAHAAVTGKNNTDA